MQVLAWLSPICKPARYVVSFFAPSLDLLTPIQDHRYFKTVYMYINIGQRMPVQNAENLQSKFRSSKLQSLYSTHKAWAWTCFIRDRIEGSFTTLIILGVSFVLLPLVHICHITVVNSSGTFDNSRPDTRKQKLITYQGVRKINHFSRE
jgi:hypothetical protein